MDYALNIHIRGDDDAVIDLVAELRDIVAEATTLDITVTTPPEQPVNTIGYDIHVDLAADSGLSTWEMLDSLGRSFDAAVGSDDPLFPISGNLTTFEQGPIGTFTIN